jgi:NitT/TauT family transport system substrate-binding protein
MNRLAVTLIAVVLAGCASAPNTASSPAAQLTKLQVGLVGGISDAAFYIANDKGWFKEQGIEIAITRFDSAAQMVAPLGTGQLDIGGGAPSAGLLNAIARDVPLKIVADKGNMDPGHGYEAMMVRKEQADKFKSPADLKGKKVAITARNISPEVTLDAFLRSGGLSVKDVQIVTMAHADMGQAIANGSIDMGMPIEPFVTQFAEKGIASIWRRNDEVFPRQQVAVVLYGPKFASDRPELAKKFMLAYLKAIRYYNDAFSKRDVAKKKEIIKILASNTAVKDEALYDKMVMPGLDFNGRVNLDTLGFQQNYYLANGAQKTRVDLDKAVDNQYVDWAAQKLGAA